MTILTPLYTSVGALVNTLGEILLAKRPEGKNYAGHWELPGGRREEGETPKQTLKREFKEEIGIDLQDHGIEAVAELRHPYPELDGGIEVICSVFLCRVWNGIPSGREGQDIQWVNPHQLSEFQLVPGDIPRLDLIVPRI